MEPVGTQALLSLKAEVWRFTWLIKPVPLDIRIDAGTGGNYYLEPLLHIVLSAFILIG